MASEKWAELNLLLQINHNSDVTSHMIVTVSINKSITGLCTANQMFTARSLVKCDLMMSWVFDLTSSSPLLWPRPMRVTWGLWLSTGLFGCCFAALEDAEGLVFVDAAALCAFHCSHALLSPASQCSPELCGRRRRTLEASDTSENPQQIDVLSCRNIEQNASTLAFSMTLSAADSAQVFEGFHHAFFEAYDAMLGGDSVTADACQLAFLQDKMLPTVEDDDTVQEEKAERKPRLIKLVSGQEEDHDRACIVSIRTITGYEQESEMPLLTRRGDRLGANTVVLIHAHEVLANQLRALECVDVVVDLPAILKLMPFARSAAQLANRMAHGRSNNASLVVAPALEIRLVQEADQLAVLSSLQQRASDLVGLLNVFERNSLQPRSIFTKPLQDLQTWIQIVALAVAESSVEWIDEQHKLTHNSLQGQEHERWSRLQNHRRLDAYVPSLVGVDSAREAGIRGNDVVVGITDTGLYLYHDQFDQDNRDVYSGMVLSARKVVMYNAWANRNDESETITCGHGTHIAGLLAGSSFSGNYPDLGIADRARIAFMDIGTQSETCAGRQNCPVSLATPADASDLVRSQLAAGARIFSFSWGTPGSDYSAQARDLDAFIYANPEVLVVVAAGNSGESTLTGQRTISSPSGAKNVISVGASLNSAASFTTFGCPEIFNERTVASFSSGGPTTDGRLKPDVVAPGMTLVSSQSEAPGSTTESSATCSLQGTSQATPVVTGVAVLLYEWLRDGWWRNGRKNTTFAMSYVPAALLKALIIHSGDSLQQRMAALPNGFVSCSSLASDAADVTYPDVYQGYGKPNLTNIVDFTGNRSDLPSLYFLPNSTENSEGLIAHNGEVVITFTVARDVDLRATLVWTDPPGSLQATSQLQHDLDLVVRILGGTQTFGPLTADPSTGRDSKNNVEMVQVTYADLLAAVLDNNSTSYSGSGNESDYSALGENGEIVVEAVVYGRSVLLADTQSFAFVASSSAIGFTSGSVIPTRSSKSFWSDWAIAIIVGCTILALIIIALITRWLQKLGKHGVARSRRRRPRREYSTHVEMIDGAYHPMYQTAPTPSEDDRCPYCLFATPDAVVMVSHVETAHATNRPVTPEIPPVAVLGGNTFYGLEPTIPVISVPPSAPAEPTEYHPCPYCRYVTSDAVVLVNHVQHMHA
ncbi:hypothetical protein CCR75_005778 [Bremia lactucae]|uniref:subtilisin n=1 Tax=Bremia lactucae TaxID=4779 RepID=A0A976IC70_BRELC|nr:hypothetical protein CCR75_005778 [Bremia lactucae]